MRKVYANAEEALAGQIKDGMTLMAGGFGLCGVPETLIEAVRKSGAKDLTFVSNNAGVDGSGPWNPARDRPDQEDDLKLRRREQDLRQSLSFGQARARIQSAGHPGRAYPRRRRGIPAFFTRTGVGTMVAEGKEIRDFNNEAYVMETGLVADISLVHAWKGDTEGNLVYRKTARNFNPMMATAARLTIAEVEHLVEPGEIDGDHIVTPGVYVQRIVHVPGALKRIEQRTIRKRDAA